MASSKPTEEQKPAEPKMELTATELQALIDKAVREAMTGPERIEPASVFVAREPKATPTKQTVRTPTGYVTVEAERVDY